MSRLDDYNDEMIVTQLGDREVELLLTGSTTTSDDLADLEGFIAALRGESRLPRDPTHMATSLAAVARSNDRPRRSGFRRLATLAVSGAMLVAFTGVALASDSSSPGDPLYWLDTALEGIGIGDGGVDERLAEFDVLLAEGEDGEAFVFLAEHIVAADELDSERALRHLALAATKSNPNAAQVQEKVALLQEFIEENRGNGVGLDGKDFGQGVSEIARSLNEPPTSESTEPSVEDESSVGPPENVGPNADKSPGPPDNAGPGNDANTGPPDQAGPKNETGTDNSAESAPGGDQETGPPDHSGPKDDKAPGPPDHAGPKDQ